MKKFKLSYILILITLFISYDFYRSEYMNRFTQAEKVEYVSAESYLENTKIEGKHIIVLYKRSCRNCIIWSDSLVSLFKGYGEDSTSYVELSSGVPSYLYSIRGMSKEDFKTPRVLIVNKQDNKVVLDYSIVVHTDCDFNNLKSYLSKNLKEN